MSPKVVLLGSNGQIGRVLTEALINRYGEANVIGSDIRHPDHKIGRFEIVDVTDAKRVGQFLDTHQPDHIYHLAALLSAKGEANPMLTWDINMGGLLNVLNSAVEKKIERVFFPSSIAVFGPTTPQILTPQDCPLLPGTVYGISKVAGENWCNYYHQRYGLDVRSLRYPGVIGYQSIPEGGTTDYAVEIFHAAIKEGHYECFLAEDTDLPMLYMPDAVKATIQLMEAESARLTVRSSYNLASMTFAPKNIAQEIKKHIPNFTISYKPDFRQQIAASWSDSIDDQVARSDWDWRPDFDLEKMTMDMIRNIK